MAFLSDRLNGLRFTPSPQSPAVAGMFASIGVNQIVPDGWFLCDGTEYDSALYPELFAAIGTAYNTGGETLGFFRVPNGPSKTVEVDLSATGTNSWSTTEAKGVAYQTALGEWRLKGNVRGSTASATGSTVTVAGISFPAFNQAATVSTNTVATENECYAIASSSGDFKLEQGAARTAWWFSFDVSLASSPTDPFVNADSRFSTFAEALESKPIIKVYTDDGAVALQGSGTQSGNAAADGDFLSGNIYYERTDNICTITTDTILTHASLSDAATSVGFLPSYMRPSLHRVSNTYFYDETNGATVFIETDGQIAVAYRDEAGTVARVDTAEPLTISYRLI